MTASPPPLARAPRPTRPRVPRLLTVVALSCLGMTGLAACSRDDTGAAAFCAALKEELRTIKGKVKDAADIDALVAVYEELDARTPLAIAEPWSALTELMRTAATVAPDDAASVQTVADAAYATERSARAVAEWVATTCGFAMPAMEGIEGPVAPPPTAKKDGAKKDGAKKDRAKDDGSTAP